MGYGPKPSEIIKEQRERLTEKLSEFPKWDDDFYPNFSGRLIPSLLSENHNMDIVNSFLEKLVNLGVLSREEQGNYSVEIPGDGDYFLGPCVNSEKLFFTSYKKAEYYRDVVRCWGKYSNCNIVMIGGMLNVLDKPSVLDWAVLRYRYLEDKNHFERTRTAQKQRPPAEYLFENLFDQLNRKGFIQEQPENGFVVRSGSSEKGTILNFGKLEWEGKPVRGNDPVIYYFTQQKYAEDFAKTFPEKKGVRKLNIVVEEAIDS